MAVRQHAAERAGSMESLAERAYQLIRDQILRGRYPLGAAAIVWTLPGGGAAEGEGEAA